MNLAFKHIIRAALLLGALLALAGAPAAVARPADVPCWKVLLNDWYDGTINNIYPLHCYDDAIKHLPQDIAIYSSAKDDFLAARQAAAKHQHAPKEKNPPPSTTTGGGTTTTGGGTSTTGGGTTTTGGGTTTTGTPDTNPPKKKHGIAGILADLTPGDPQAFPLPLLVLGALAILLVAAGGAGMLWQRTHPRDTDTE